MEKNSLLGIVLGIALVGSLDRPAVAKQVDLQSPFAKSCISLNLDPQNTSNYELYAVKLGLPKTATPDQIIERKYGFNPMIISGEELQLRLKSLGYGKVRDLYHNLLYSPQ